MDYTHMFTPITINGCVIPNRFAVTAVVSDTCTEDGFATEKYIRYHEEKAKGGFGLIITENYITSRHAGGYKYVAGLYDESLIPGHKKLTDTVHKYGTKIFCQIYHAGRQSSSKVNGGVEPVAPSPTSCPWNREMPRELTVSEIKQIVRDFGVTAANAKKAGFDGVEIHAGNGYLIAGFMSFFENKRTDEYGGCFKNRMRLLDEVYESVRAAVGPDFPLTVRFSADENTLSGRGLAEARMVAKHMQELGFDAINCSNGVYGTYNPGQVSCFHQPHAWTINNAREIKKVVSIPVLGCNSIDDPLMAESLVEQGFCDIVGMARCSLADPAMPNKARSGHEEEIRPCIRCMQGCVTSTYLQRPLRCCVNPELCMEDVYDYSEKPEPKRVLVIGGGPAGMQAAIAAARRGHSVTLFEKTGSLGGQFISAAYPPGKGEYITYICYMVNELKKLGVAVELNKNADTQSVLDFGADKVIIATGAVPKKPDIPGIDGANVYWPEDILRGKKQVEGEIVVIGGGESGAETAMYLADAERGHITLLSRRNIICHKADGTIRIATERYLKERGVDIVCRAEAREIYPDAVLACVGGEERRIACDAVIVAMGYAPYRPLDELCRLLGDKAVCVGDANDTGNAMDAGAEGFRAGYFA